MHRGMIYANLGNGVSSMRDTLYCEESFLFFAEFLEDHCVEVRKMVFFIFAGIGGTNPRPARRAISPSGAPFPAEMRRTESAGQGRT